MGAVFSMFGGIYYWFDKITGVAYNEILGQIHFWIFFIGVNFTFFPMHFLGVAGMPRRIPDYPDAFYAYNKIASWGSYISAWSTLVFFFVLYEAFSSNNPQAINPKIKGSLPIFIGFIAIVFVYMEVYKFAFLAIGYLFLHYTSVGQLVLDILNSLRDTREKIHEEIKGEHFYLYYFNIALGFSVLISFTLLFVVYPDSVFVQNLVGIVILCYIVVSVYRLTVTRKFYQKYNNQFGKNKLTTKVPNSQERYFHASAKSSMVTDFLANLAVKALNNQGTIAYCTNCVVTFGGGYIAAHTYSNNRFVSPNAFTNTFNIYAPTGLGFKYIPNSFQPGLHDYIVTQRSLRGQELNEFYAFILDKDGYMNTEKAKQYADKHNITLPSNLFQFKKD